jgi:hypothetical protein
MGGRGVIIGGSYRYSPDQPIGVHTQGPENWLIIYGTIITLAAQF